MMLANNLGKTLVSLLGVVIYLGSILTILYLLAFIADVGPFYRATAIIPPSPLLVGIQDVLLIGIFGLHHSIAARSWYKERFTRWFPKVLERTSYLSVSILLTGVLIHFWEPLPIVLWEFTSPVSVYAIRTMFLGAFAVMLFATFQIGHFRFFGLAQTLESWFERHPAQPGFTQRLLYRLVRHPISFGWLVLPWLVPVFTVGQLILGLGFALYILAVTPLEEAELRREIGHDYDAYAKKTPRFFPYLLPRNR